ncbi:unnamed protein product [Timema podura]|uniref:SAM domain-containing protein n=1 Tax=Timema podura TaxID=61482 RepID=A0ABN7P2M2_TIMPD|nr:unnamed protein product [Timema podura]
MRERSKDLERVDAGLFKGSTSQGQDGPRAERPKTLRRLRNVYEGGGGGGGVGLAEDGEEAVCKRPGRGGGCPGVSGGPGDKSLSILSPFDEQEEWAKISEIMASFGSGLARDSVFVSELEKEFQSRMGAFCLDYMSCMSGMCGKAIQAKTPPYTRLESVPTLTLSSTTTKYDITASYYPFSTLVSVLTHSSSNSPIVGSSVGQWLASLGLAEYESLFHNNGFDDLDFINGVIEAQDLKDMGLNSDSDINTILGAAQSLPCKVNNNLAANNNNNNSLDAVSTADGSVAVSPVETWLKSIHLDCYVDTFHKHLYKDMERVRRIWEVELTAVLEIHKAGHRRRILTSVSGHQQPGPNLEDINADLNQLGSSNSLGLDLLIYQDSNLNFPVIGRLVYCEGNALYHATTEIETTFNWVSSDADRTVTFCNDKMWLPATSWWSQTPDKLLLAWEKGL